jgi:hypothetical protein
MSADQLKLGIFIKNQFSDLIYINSSLLTN